MRVRESAQHGQVAAHLPVSIVVLAWACGWFGAGCTPERHPQPYLGYDATPRCSSSGAVAYMHWPGAGDTRPIGLYVVGLDSLRERLLATDYCQFEWLPGTDSLLVWRINAPPRMISSVSGDGRTLSVDVWGGSIAPDGQWLAYTTSAVSGNWNRETVALLNLITGETRDITPDSMLYSAPSWSPSGDRLVVLGGSRSGSGIFIIDAAGAPVRRIVAHSGVMRSPAWSPRGDLVAWTEVTGAGALYVVDTLGTTKRFVTAAREACWEPDGDALVYAVAVRNVLRLFEYRLSTGRTRQITQ